MTLAAGLLFSRENRPIFDEGVCDMRNETKGATCCAQSMLFPSGSKQLKKTVKAKTEKEVGRVSMRIAAAQDGTSLCI